MFLGPSIGELVGSLCPIVNKGRRGPTCVFYSILMVQEEKASFSHLKKCGQLAHSHTVIQTLLYISRNTVPQALALLYRTQEAIRRCLHSFYG